MANSYELQIIKENKKKRLQERLANLRAQLKQHLTRERVLWVLQRIAFVENELEALNK